MHATHDETVDISSIDISHHARLRTMQRLGVIERAGQYVRELLAKAEPVDVPWVKDAKAYQVGSVTIVVGEGADGEVVQTVLRREVADG